jgi:hypothetical protein
MTYRDFDKLRVLMAEAYCAGLNCKRDMSYDKYIGDLDDLDSKLKQMVRLEDE